MNKGLLAALNRWQCASFSEPILFFVLATISFRTEKELFWEKSSEKFCLENNTLCFLKKGQ
jgi:hypothetical protein